MQFILIIILFIGLSSALPKRTLVEVQIHFQIEAKYFMIEVQPCNILFNLTLNSQRKIEIINKSTSNVPCGSMDLENGGVYGKILKMKMVNLTVELDKSYTFKLIYNGNITKTELLLPSTEPYTIERFTLKSELKNRKIQIKVNWDYDFYKLLEIMQFVIFIFDNSTGRCVHKKVMDCTNCFKTADKIGSRNNLQTQCNTVNHEKFEKFKNSYLAVITGELQPVTKYQVTFKVANAWGYSQLSSPQYVLTTEMNSGKVSNLQLNSVFVDKKIKVSFDIPKQPNGNIIQINAEIYNSSNCLVNIIGVVKGNYKKTYGKFCTETYTQNIKLTDSPINLFTDSNLIEPDYRYRVKVYPVNSIGPGELVEDDIVTQRVRIWFEYFKCENLTSTSIKCNWAIKKTDKIPSDFYKFQLSCFQSNIQSNIIFESTVDGTDSIQHYPTTYLVKIKENIIPNISYTCQNQIFSKTNRHYDIKNSTEVYTTIYIPPKIDNTIKLEIAHILNETKKPEQAENRNIDRATQIPVTIPFSKLPILDQSPDSNNSASKNKSKTEKKLDVKFVTIVVSSNKSNIESNGEVEKDSDSPFSRCYEDCDKGRKCAYEVQLDVNKNKSEDRSFVIGEDSNCKGKSRCKCNGPVAPETKYTVGIRVYTHRGFLTMAEVSKETVKIWQLPWQIYVIPMIAIGVFILVSFFGLSIYRRNQRFIKPGSGTTQKIIGTQSKSSTSFVNESSDFSTANTYSKQY